MKGLCYNCLNRYAPSSRSTASLAGVSGGVLSILAQKLIEDVSLVEFIVKSAKVNHRFDPNSLNRPEEKSPLGGTKRPPETNAGDVSAALPGLAAENAVNAKLRKAAVNLDKSLTFAIANCDREVNIAEAHLAGWQSHRLPTRHALTTYFVCGMIKEPQAGRAVAVLCLRDRGKSALHRARRRIIPGAGRSLIRGGPTCRTGPQKTGSPSPKVGGDSEKVV